jgi:hypothetical protein
MSITPPGDAGLDRARALSGAVGRHARERALELLTAHTAAVEEGERAAALNRVFAEVRDDDSAVLALVCALASYGAAIAETAVALSELPMAAELTAGALIGGLARTSLTLD